MKAANYADNSSETAVNIGEKQPGETLAEKALPELVQSRKLIVNKTPEKSNAYIGSIELPEIAYKSNKLFPASQDETTTALTIPGNLTEKNIIPESADISSAALNTRQNSIESAVPESLVTHLPDSATYAKLSTDKSMDNTLRVEFPQINTIIERKQIVTIKKGDTLSGIFKHLSLNSKSLHKLLKSGPDAKRLTKIKPGYKLTFTLDSENQILAISYPLNKIDTLIVNKKADSFITEIISKEVEVKQQFATGTISASLFAAGNQAGLSNSMIMKLAHLFGWDIDFALDIRKGDSFSLVYEEKFINDEKVSEGDILAAEFVNQGKTFYALRYTDASGRTEYYSDKGYSMRKAFLRSPVEFSRISSRFSSGRKHPVLNRIRAHKGVDYAATRGTPIKAAGSGKVIFKGKKGGYGRVVILQHGTKYTTLYAHLNAYNKKIKQGSRVTQGQVIGYVGSSGLATGPHLHYEFRVNGVHRNPLTVPLPDAAPLAKKYRQDFELTAENMISQIKSRKQSAIALKSE